MTIQALASKVQRLDEAYRAGHPLVSDAEFDGIRDELACLAPDHPVLKVPGGGQKLLSLGNQSFDSWWNQIPSFMKEKNNRLGDVIIAQPKIDGVSIALRYEEGYLVSAWTRSGREVTAYMRQVANVPQDISGGAPIEEGYSEEIRGELYGKGLSGPQSQRLAAGFLRKKAPNGKGLSFCAFQLMDDIGISSYEAEGECIEDLRLSGFETPGCIYFSKDVKQQARILHEQWLDGILFSRWPSDGFVLKLNYREDQATLGEDSRAPRWALAIKDTWKEGG